MDTSLQKAGIQGFHRCVEHTSVFSKLCKEANKEGVLTAAVVWLDLANTYWSVPHKLIEPAMKLYHLPGNVQRIIGGIQIQFIVDEFATFWQRVEKGIFTGCTISPILFVIGIGMLTGSAERETRGPRMNSGIYQPPTRGFKNDLTVTTSTHLQARWVHSTFKDIVSWACIN